MKSSHSHGARIVPLKSSPRGYRFSLNSRQSRAAQAKFNNGPRISDLRTNAQLTPVSFSFAQTFGLLGIPLVLMILVSIVWTAWLIVLTIAPNQTANYLMGTTPFDDGDFWLIIDPEPVFMTVSALCLGVLLISYANVVLKMTVRRNAKCSTNLAYRVLVSRLYRMSKAISPRLRLARKSFKLWNELNNFDGRRRKIFNACHKSLDLSIQIAALYRLLEDGIPSKLCYVYASLVAANSLFCAALILFPSSHSAFFEVFVDTIFDMLFAVGWPIWWLWYSYTGFNFDRAKALLYLAIYPEAWYERQARRMANSSEVTHFMISFDALRMKSGLDLCLRMAMNFSFSHRLSRVVQFMIRRQKIEVASKRSPKGANKQLHIQRPTALIFVFASVGVLVHTHESIVFSGTVCAVYPECVAYAYRWSKGESCPCRALVNVDKGPRTYAEWIYPPDAAANMKKLATSGDLRVIEVMNRQLSVLPDELQRCSELQSITLAYTGIESVPAWAARFTKLEYLSIEGRPMDRNLVTLPNTLLDHMKSLTFLHLGVHQSLTTLSSMAGPTNLKAFSVALLLSLQEIPPLISLPKLKRVLIVGDNAMARVPNLSPRVHVDGYAVGDIRACCNGYIGVCDLTHYLCAKGVTCLDKQAPENQPNAVTQRLLESVAVQTCKSPSTAADFLVSPTEEDVEACGGQMYRQCRMFQGNATGMCYSARMQVIACQNATLNELVRREEIKRGVGLPCDEKVEKWLGCGS